MPTYLETHADDDNIWEQDLFEIVFPGGTVRWTDADNSISALGYTWTPANISHSGISSRAGEIAGTASIRVGNADYATSALVLSSSIIGGAVTITRVRLPTDSSNMVSLAEKVLFVGQLLEPHDIDAAGEAWVEIQLAPSDSLDREIPALGIALTGDATLGDERCQSTGAATFCGKTLAECSMTDKVNPPAAGGNSVNFCGIPFLLPESNIA